MAVLQHHVIPRVPIEVPTEPTEGVLVSGRHRHADVAAPIVGDGEAKVGLYHHVPSASVDQDLPVVGVG